MLCWTAALRWLVRMQATVVSGNDRTNGVAEWSVEKLGMWINTLLANPVYHTMSGNTI